MDHKEMATLGGVTPCEQDTYTIVRETFGKMISEESSDVTAYSGGKVQMSNGHKRGRSKDSSNESVSPPENWRIGVCADKHDFLSSFQADDIHDLNGRMLQEALDIVQDHVKMIKDSWTITGCSILLDAWIDQKGHDLVAFIADCPAGPVYLRSYDVSDIKTDVKGLISLVDGLIDEVGVSNVVQIIACSTSGWVGELGKSFAGNKRRVFWSVCVSHCFELMLAKIRKMDCFEDVLNKVNNIWKFINNNPSVLETLRDHIDMSHMTVLSSEFEFVTPYLVIERISKAKKNLAAMFASSDLNKEEDVSILELVNDSSFWETVERLMKSTSPLIHGLGLFSTANNQHVGYIYDAMDDIKESIASGFNHKELCYKPLWDVIDDVWDKHLHSPLHAAGYFLNPNAIYSTHFHLDQEVATGLISSLVHMVKDNHTQAVITAQLDMYRLGIDCFHEASQADQIARISPAEWWTEKAKQYEELQSFAVKILSQTCVGASRYKLKRSSVEKMLLLTKGISACEQEHLEKLVFIHYNLHLQSQAK